MLTPELLKKITTRARSIEAVVIGGSAGTVEALSMLLPALPRSSQIPFLVVVHLPPERESAIPELFRGKCQVEVKEAEDKEPISPGIIYFAPPNYHLLVEPDRRLSLSSDEPVLFSRPSIDVLFESAADAYGAALAGVILTGANNDGANGLRAICKAGGLALVQAPPSAASPAMPEAALAGCPEARAFRLEELTALMQYFSQPT